MLANWFKVLGAFLLLSPFTALKGQSTIYLEYNSSCIDELEYVQASVGMKSRAYAVNFSSEQYIFYTAESGVSVSSLPSGTVGCRDATLNQALVDAVNNGQQQMTIVRQHSDRSYQLMAVTNAMQVIKSGSFYVIRAKDFVAALDTSQLVYESNLAGPGSPSNVFLTGLKVYDCRVLYALRSEPAEIKGDETHFDFAPGLGLVSVSSGLTPSALQYSRNDLVKVNGYELADWIARLCGSPMTPTPPTTGITQPQQPTSPAADANVKYHIVQSGETLNSISREYNVPVATLMAWNNINNPNLIKRGQRIIISEPGSAAGLVPGGNTTNPGITQPPVSGYEGNLPTYTVKQGEKLKDIANRNGYTEAYLRQMNSLPARIELAAGTVIVISDCPCKRTVAQPVTGGTLQGNSLAPVKQNVEAQSAKPAPQQESQPYTDIRFKEYTVKKGDTMQSIAASHKVDVKELAYLNSKRVDERLIAGQKLYIPVSQ